MHKKGYICMVLLVCFALYTGAQTTDPGTKKAKQVPLSLFIPGVYQLKNNQYIKGGLLLGAFAASISAALIFNKKGNDWYDKYRNSTNIDEIVRLRDKTEKTFKKRNLCIAGIFSVWLVHIIDVKFFKPKKGKAGVKGEAGNNTLSVGFYCSF